MTFNKTTTPSTDTGTVPQTSADDPFGLDDIPDFLRRVSGKTADEILPVAQCDSCQEKCPVPLLKEPEHLEQRMDYPPGHPDRIEPAGECPHCGALAYAI